jgi:hypothetical protein
MQKGFVKLSLISRRSFEYSVSSSEALALVETIESQAQAR